METAFEWTLAALAITFLVVVHESGHYLAARAFKMRVLRYSLGFGPVIAKWQPKDSPTIFQISAVPILAYVQVDGMNPADDNDPNDPELYCNQSVWKRLVVVLAGPFANYLAATLIIFGLYAIGGVPEADPERGMLVTQIEVDSPAARAGMLPGDEVVEANGVAVHTVEELIEQTRERAGLATLYRVRRDGGLLAIELTPISDQPEGETAPRGRIGVHGSTPVRYRQRSFSTIAKLSALQPIFFTELQIAGIAHNIRNMSLEGVGGPPQMLQMVAEQAHRGWREFVYIVFAISVALGFFNLLPVPALDGGRAMFLLAEAVSRRKMNARLETAATLVGFVMLVSLILFVSIRGS